MELFSIDKEFYEFDGFTPDFSNNPPLLRATRRRTDAAVTIPFLLCPCTCVAIFCHTFEVVPTIPAFEIVNLIYEFITEFIFQYHFYCTFY